MTRKSEGAAVRNTATRLENVHVLCPKRDIYDNFRPISVHVFDFWSETQSEMGRKQSETSETGQKYQDKRIYWVHRHVLGFLPCIYILSRHVLTL